MKKNKELGITLVTLMVAVCILIIISSILIYNARTGIRLRNLKMMYNDIELLSDKVNSYYTKYGALPAEIEYEGNIYFEQQPNDNDIYYVVDLNALDGISLNYGHDFKNITSDDDTLAYNDIYIINEESHHIYYARGIEMDEDVYYTNDEDDSVSIKPVISINLTLTHENKKLNANELPNVKEVTNENVPIPQGFYYVGGTKNEGVVISDVEGDDLDNSKQGNQFVWIPVNQNQKLMLEVRSNEKIKEIIITRPDNTQQTITTNEKTYNGEIEMTRNGIYEVEVKTETSSKTENKRISSLYAQDVKILTLTLAEQLRIFASEEYNTVSEFLTAKNANSIEEFLNSVGYDSISQYMTDKQIYIEELKEDYEKSLQSEMLNLIDYNQNPESVNKYGGYYIGRYEAGDGTTTSQRIYSSPDTNTLVSKKGAYSYIYISCNGAKRLSSAMYSGNSAVTSQLITCAGWDRALNWIIETGEKTEYEVIINSCSWGNFINSTGNAAINAGESNLKFITGRSEYWKTNNIYDLAGNMWEWTQETYLGIVFDRGGAYDSYGEINPAGIHYVGNRNNTSPDWEDDNDSFRVQLYINI